jgi:sigma-54-specific transcriptional regulator
MSQGLNLAVSPRLARSAALANGNTEVVSRDAGSKLALQQLDRLAPSDATILIVGESGTGKELTARRVHERSERRGPFVAVNCGALTESLAEAELFGHEGGSFTGATATRIGWFEAAEGGTLLLDEVSELPAELQVKILRVLQEREVVRVGSRRARRIDVRVIAASNVDLARAVMEGRFRADLYYRLNVAAVSLPPLRERRADIVPLAEHFLAKHGERLRSRAAYLTADARRALLSHSWPGNIRELENVIQAAMMASADGALRPEHLRLREEASLPSAATRSAARDQKDAAAAGPGGALGHRPGAVAANRRDARAADALSAQAAEALALGALAGPLDELLQSGPSQLFPKVEEFLVRRAFSHCRGNQMLTARLLGVSGNVMRAHLRRYGLIDERAATHEVSSAGAWACTL